MLILIDLYKLFQDDFKKLQTNDYDSNDPFSFRSLFFEGLDKTICCSARRYDTQHPLFVLI